MIFSQSTDIVLFFIMSIFFIIMLVLFIKDIYKQYKHYKKKKEFKSLTFDNYQEIKDDSSKYVYYIPYGVSHSLIQFISETPHFIDAIDTVTKKNRVLIEKYNSETDKEKISTYINIGIQLSNIIANTGKILMNQCRFYCVNSSASFQVICEPSLIQQYCITADLVYEQFERIKAENIDTPEIKNTINHMYREFFDYFEQINSLVKIIPNQKGDHYND